MDPHSFTSATHPDPPAPPPVSFRWFCDLCPFYIFVHTIFLRDCFKRKIRTASGPLVPAPVRTPRAVQRARTKEYPSFPRTTGHIRRSAWKAAIPSPLRTLSWRPRATRKGGIQCLQRRSRDYGAVDIVVRETVTFQECCTLAVRPLTQDS